MIDFLISINKVGTPLSLTDLFIHKPPTKLSYSNLEIEFLAWGDPICDEKFKVRFTKQPDVSFIINNLYGHYYFILLNKTNYTIYTGNSLFSILPVYYTETNKDFRISNDPISLKNEENSNKYNKRFLLENILFNYPLFNQSCIEGVNLLPANHYIQIKNGRATNHQHTGIVNYFSTLSTPWPKAIDTISDLFIESSEKYFSEEKYASALTGGFDGRTLTACGLYKKKRLMTYSFGSEESEDVKIAESISTKTGIEFIKINLDGDYLNNHSLNAGIGFINGSSGTASFARAHYLYAAKILSAKTNYLVTGNFGSEIFRAAHNTGVVISQNLHGLFIAKNYDSAIRLLETSPEWDWINKQAFKHEWESLKEELKTLSCFDYRYKCLTKNQQFYIIVFEEVFRKYFGAEMVNQYKYFVNRTPFLDNDFLKGIFVTGLAGVHSDFFTNNPFKRFKGQILYANIIKKTWPDFGKEITDKGYKPEDLLSLFGKLRIAGSFLSKRAKRKESSEEDPFAVNAAFSVNKDTWLQLSVAPTFFNSNTLLKAIQTPSNSRDSLFIAMSQAYFYIEKFATQIRNHTIVQRIP
jgi:asparagine synthase (glutamine-hydrolysing)